MDRKNRVGPAGALIIVAFAFAIASFAQTSPERVPSHAAQQPDSMTAFWEKFKTAVIKGDKETVAALSSFPLSMGYGMRSLRNKAQFLKHYRQIFSGETNAALCFSTAKPLVEKTRPKEFTIGCSYRSSADGSEPFEYRFVLTRNGWRLNAFENINE